MKCTWFKGGRRLLGGMAAGWMFAAVAGAAEEPVLPEREAGSAPEQFYLSSRYVHQALSLVKREAWADRLPAFEVTLVRRLDPSRYPIQVGGIDVQVLDSPAWVGYEYLPEGVVMVSVKLSQKW